MHGEGLGKGLGLGAASADPLASYLRFVVELAASCKPNDCALSGGPWLLGPREWSDGRRASVDDEALAADV